jgi:glycosyltransferase involved in cell wall biosynthesis
MKILIDASTKLHGGGGLYMCRLLENWSRLGAFVGHELVIVGPPQTISILIPMITTGAKVITIAPHWSVGCLRVLWQQVCFPVLIRKLRPDVVFCPANIAPILSHARKVLVLHNAAPFSAAISLQREGVARWISFRILRWLMRASIRSATTTVFLSEYLKGLLGSVSSRNAEVLYLGSDFCKDSQFRKINVRQSATTPYLLCVSHIYPYKNLSALIEGFSLALPQLMPAGILLYIAGVPVVRRENDRLLSVIRRHGLQDRVILLGAIPPENIAPLMRDAYAFVFQSLCENCPSTLIEALNAGVPIACSDASVMPEIAGSAARYFNACYPADIARALVDVCCSEKTRERLRSAGPIRAATFPSWDEVALRTFALIEGAAVSSPECYFVDGC